VQFSRRFSGLVGGGNDPYRVSRGSGAVFSKVFGVCRVRERPLSSFKGARCSFLEGFRCLSGAGMTPIEFHGVHVPFPRRISRLPGRGNDTYRVSRGSREVFLKVFASARVRERPLSSFEGFRCSFLEGFRVCRGAGTTPNTKWTVQVPFSRRFSGFVRCGNDPYLVSRESGAVFSKVFGVCQVRERPLSSFKGVRCSFLEGFRVCRGAGTTPIEFQGVHA
jgi:hypothetical protein